MEIAFVIDPPQSLKAYKDTSVAMMRALQSRGHALHVLEQAELYWRAGATQARVRRIEVLAGDHDWYRAGEPVTRPLTSFAAVVMRKDPPFDMEYVYSTYLLEAAEREGACVVNRPRAIRDHNEKWAIAEFPQFTVPTLVTRDPELIGGFIDEQADVILKPLDGMGGSSVFRVRRDDVNRNVIIETMAHFGARSVMAQRFIPEIAQGDKRIIVIAGEPAPHALARIPKAGETRGNLAAGGRGEARPLSARDREIAEVVGRALAPRGLFVIGLDVIGDYLTEINVTSPTGFVEITQQTGFDVAGAFAQALETSVPAR
ncbi:MAG TPA: glutathione synthase [Casimicrobiaceae bacterium]|jgi:glutathione synthase